MVVNHIPDQTPTKPIEYVHMMVDQFTTRRVFIGIAMTIALLCASFPFSVHAQEADDQNASGDEQQSEQVVEVAALKASAGKDRNVVKGRTVLFDASATTGPEEGEYTYTWDFGDGSTAEGIDATHVYQESGVFRATLNVSVTSTNENVEPQSSSSEIIVSVQDRLVVLISDQSVDEEEVQQLRDYASTQGVQLVSVRDSGVDQEFQTTQNIADQLFKNQEDVIASDFIVTWTAGTVGLNSLIEFARIATFNDISLDTFGLGSKAVIAVPTGQSLSTSAKTAQSAFQAVQPRYVVVADDAILDDIMRAESPDRFEQNLPSVDAEYQIITQYTARGLESLGLTNFMSYAMNYMVNHGVPLNSLYLILMLPVMATIIAAARQLAGIKALGIFIPTIVALSFLVTGLKYGVVIFVSVLILGSLARYSARRFRLLYLPRMAIVLTLLALALGLMYLVSAYLGLTGFITVSILPILIMTALAEHFVSVQITQGMNAAVKLAAETLFISAVGYAIADWTFFKTTLLAYPELILLTLVINYLLGKYSGLRLSEYLRFRLVFKQMSHGEGQK